MKNALLLKPFDPTIDFLSALTICLGLAPLVLYAVGRINNWIPTQVEWEKHVGNHGPWFGLWQGDVVTLSCCAMMALPLLTISLCIALSLGAKEQKRQILTQGFVLSTIQFASLLLLINTVFWVTD